MKCSLNFKFEKFPKFCTNQNSKLNYDNRVPLLINIQYVSRIYFNLYKCKLDLFEMNDYRDHYTTKNSRANAEHDALTIWTRTGE